MFYNGQQKHDQQRIETLQGQLKAARDSVHLQGNGAGDGFALKDNDNAIDYFVDQGITDIDGLILKIKDGIADKNTNPQGNPLTGYEPVNGQKFLINKVHILNNRWIIADFSNGTAWGDVLIRYFVEKNGTVTYEAIQSVLYSSTVK
jgi:hypothetical protein